MYLARKIRTITTVRSFFVRNQRADEGGWFDIYRYAQRCLPDGVLLKSMTGVFHVLVFSLIVNFLWCSQVRAQTLKAALAAAYLDNPTLKAERAGLRATDEEAARARSGYRPRLSANADASSNWTETKPGNGSFTRSRGYSLTLSQPIFRGLRTINSVRQADDTILAGREQLRDTEQRILLQTVTAYMDVVRDQSLLRLRKDTAKFLKEQLRGVKDRFDVGEVTKTDVAQAQARYSRALSDINIAEAQLKNSRSNYQLAVGRLPVGRLREPPSVESLVLRTLGENLRRGAQENPLILGAVYRERASRHAVDVIRGESLPEVNLQAQYSKRFDPSSLIEESETASITGQVSIPLYQGGEVAARVRQARETNTQRQIQIDEARRKVHADIINAWGQMKSARARIDAGKAFVSASKTALEGVREEEKVGQRTILDTLNAEQELVDARITLVQAKRDYVVAIFTLISGTGRLTIAELNIPVAQYDPRGHYNAVRNKWRGFVTPDAAYYNQSGRR